MELLLRVERELLSRRGLNVPELARELQVHVQTIRRVIHWLEDRAGMDIVRTIDVDRRHFWRCNNAETAFFTAHAYRKFL